MLSDEHRDLLLAELRQADYDGLTSEQAFEKLHGAPAVMETRAAPISIDGLMAVLSPESLAHIAEWSLAGRLADDITAQSRAAVGRWALLLRLSGKITEQEAAAVMSQLSATETVDAGRRAIPRFVEAFSGIPGMPNRIDEEDFAAVFSER
jgi:hypothetical protein